MTEVLKMRFLVRSRTAAEWTELNEVLLTSTEGTGAREMGMEEDTGKYKLGDGVTPWNDLPYQAGGGSSSPLNINVQTGATYTAQVSDKGGEIQCTIAATITIPKDTFQIGDWFLTSQAGDGTVTTVGATGVTFETETANATSGKGDLVGYEMVAANVWRFIGGSGSGGSGGGISDVIAGANVSIDKTDPQRPIINAAGGTGTGGIPYGTAFPTSPAPFDLFFRTDDTLLYFFNGTYWLTVNEYNQDVNGVGGGVLPFSATNPGTFWVPIPSAKQIFVTYVDYTTYVATTPNDASNHWLCYLSWRGTADSSVTALHAPVDTTGDPVSSGVGRTIAINAPLPATATFMQNSVSKIGSPGSVYPWVQFRYRFVGT